MPTGPASLIARRTRWRDATSILFSRLPVRVRRWVVLRTSMTRALEARFGPGIRVAVRFDGQGGLRADEASLLGTRRRCAQVREVVLRLGERDLLAARTVHVSRRLKSHAALVSLGSRPLGELLFASGTPRRLRREIAQVSVRHALRRPCWARRTVYGFERQRMLVTEVFLGGMVTAGWGD